MTVYLDTRAINVLTLYRVMLAEAQRPYTPGKHVQCSSQQRQLGGKIQGRSSSQRSSLSGLEMKTELLWENWELQREFTNALVLKNVHNKLQRLQFRLPVSEVFTTLDPHTIVLSPGTSFSLPVTFKPLHLRDYEGTIEFRGKDCSFQVRLLATCPRHTLEVPDSVLLPLSAVEHSSHTTFMLRNTSKLQTCFQWECTMPFQLSPEQGRLNPGQECEMKVVFQPQEALVYKQQACCMFGEAGDETWSHCTLLLQGLAKYPYLQLRTQDTKDEKQQNSQVLDFGTLAVSQSLQKHFDIANPSPVTASFSLAPPSDLVPFSGLEFSCDVTKGTLAPGGSLRATVTYTPAVVDAVSVAYLSLKCRGALTESHLKLTGGCVGLKLSLSSSVVDFGCVKEGGVVTQTVELVNPSPIEAIYQWDLDCSGHSVFKIQPASGYVRSYSQTTFKAVYRPTQPNTHYRRVACLVMYEDPLFLDLIGTCHSELRQPAILKSKHLVLLNWPQEQNTPDSSSIEQQDQDTQGMVNPSEERPDIVTASRIPMEEYYQSCLGCVYHPSSGSSSSPPLLSVVPSEIQFNQETSPSLFKSPASSQCVSITNNSKGIVRLVSTAAPDSAFSVFPLTCIFAPRKVTSFRVTYDPKQLNTLHSAQLEWFAYYEDDHHTDEVPCPPWCVTVRVIGHSFQPGIERFIPCCSLKPTQVVFPGCSVLAYQTALLQNSGDQPFTFCLNHSSDPGPEESVTLVPRCGLVRPGSHQILTLRTTPSEDSPKQGFSLRIQLNTAHHVKELTVVSVVEQMRLSLEGKGSIYFQPTAVGSQTQRSHYIRNLSRFPLRYQWSIREADQHLLRVEPQTGELHPNDISVQMWSFSPLTDQTYIFTPSLTYWPIQTPGFDRIQRILKVLGMGCIGSIEPEKTALDLGEILVGISQTVKVPLLNNSPCPVSFSLSVQQTFLDEKPTDDPETVPCALQLGFERGTLASQSTMLLQSTVIPHTRAQYLWTISYQTLDSCGCVTSPPQAVCEVRAKSEFPTLKVVDVYIGGSLSNLSKKHLWRLFSLDSLNQHMRSRPSPKELTYKTPTRHSVRACPSIFTDVMVDFNFSAAPLNSDPSVFVLMFNNPGSIPVDWAFLFPEDQQMELEYWAESGALSSMDLYQMKVQLNQVFSVSPRSGTLLPGKQRAVRLSYRHDFVGTDQFPVVLKLSHGREIMLNFQGVTVERDRPYLHFVFKRHVFTSVNVGDCAPPKQVYELHNGGAVSLQYEVDLAVLSQLQADNFNHPVLGCLNPKGEIAPGKTAPLEWIFSPMEAKMYQMDVPIHVEDGDSTLVRFEGCGLNPFVLGSKGLCSSSDTETQEPGDQRRPFPGQVVFLSEDTVSLGDIPVGSRSSRILFLTNVSESDTYHYTWETSIWQMVQIHPEQGRLHPGQSALCVLTFTSTDHPAYYQLDVLFQVLQEATLTQYHDALQRWQEEEERRKDEFIITDKNPKRGPRAPRDKELVAVRKLPPLRKYKTLPPICTSGSLETLGSLSTNSTTAVQQEQREATNVMGRPEPPRPALLHLEITANSHGIQDYLVQFPDQIHKHYRVNQSSPAHNSKTNSLSWSFPTEVYPLTNGPEKTISTHILTSLLRDVLDDPAFTQFLFTSKFEAISYQLTEPDSSHGSSVMDSLPSPSSSCPTLSHSTPPLQTRTREKHHQEEREGRARYLGNTPETQNTALTDHVTADTLMDVVLNTLQNLMMEAARGDFLLTEHL